jgi:hypothetical protein
LIVTTDADCLPTKEWLEIIASFKEETNAVFIAAPVVINCNSSVLQIFQVMDLWYYRVLPVQLFIKTLSMCNGANLAYERNAFYNVNGFAGIDGIASGDDMLLMHKITKHIPTRFVI